MAAVTQPNQDFYDAWNGVGRHSDPWRGVSGPNRQFYAAVNRTTPTGPSKPPLRPMASDLRSKQPTAQGGGAVAAGGAPRPAGGGGSGQGRGGLSYQAGINAERPAINAGNILERSSKEGRLAGVTSGAAKDFLKGQQSEDAANLRRGISLENAQQNMAAQANRSELFQAGIAQQVDQFSKMAQHRANQTSMAVDWFQKMMQGREALMQSLMK